MARPAGPGPTFSQSQLQSIADALGDTDIGLSGSEIGHLLRVCKIPDPDAKITKRHRLLNGFVASQNAKQHRRNILQFMREAMAPAFHARQPERFEPLRAKLNFAIALRRPGGRRVGGRHTGRQGGHPQ